ncbi:MAG: hypothetical protein ACREER_03545 [Alphaproteobacteria bacterium]
MTQHRYPFGALAGDYARAAAGLALTAGPLALVPAAPAVAWTLGAMAVLFAAFGARTAARHATTIGCDEDALVVAGGPWPACVAWRDLDRLKLSFFPTRRDRSQGWMQLRLRARQGRPVTVDSAVTGFDTIVGRAVAAARANGVRLSDATRANLGARGHVAGADGMAAPTAQGPAW